MTVLRDIRLAAPSSDREIGDDDAHRRIVPADVPEVEPAGSTFGVDVQYWLSIQTVIYADQATATGLTATIVPWYYYSALMEDPAGSGGTGGWISGRSIDIPLSDLDSGISILDWDISIADRFYLQVSGIDGPGLSWMYVGHFGLVPRATAAPSLATGQVSTLSGEGGGGVSGQIEIKDEGSVISSSVRVINFVGADVVAAPASAPNEVDVYIPPVPTSPYLGQSTGAISWPSVGTGYVARPEGGEGTPYYTNGWADNVSTRPRMINISVFSGSLGLTHSSARVTDLHLGQIDCTITDGNGNTETASLVLNPAGGDQDATSAGGNVQLHVRNTVSFGSIVEGRVYVDVDVASFLAVNAAGPSGYFKLELNHTASPVLADFGEVFWDGGIAPNGSWDPTATLNTATYKYLSGVPYYTTGSTFLIEDSPTNGVNDAVNATIDPDKDILLVNVSEFNATVGEVDFDSATISGLTYDASNSPIRNETPDYAEIITVGSAPHRVTDAHVYTTWHNYHGNEVGSPKSSLGAGISIDTWPVTATPEIEYFDDEAYRLQDEDTNDFSITKTNYGDWVGTGGGTDERDWDSVQHIGVGSMGHTPGLQVGSGILQYPTVNYSSGRLPVGPDYSGLLGDRYYYRAFFVGDLLTHKNFRVSLNVYGFTMSDFEIGLGTDDSTDGRVDIMFPGPNKTPMDGANSSTFPGSGWLHCGKQFNYPVFTGVDNDGCLSSISQFGNTINLDVTTKNLSSEYCNGIVIVRLRAKSSVGASKYFSGMSVGGL